MKKTNVDLTDVKVVETQKNRIGLRGHLVLNVLICIAYAIDYFKGQRTFGSYLLTVLLYAIPNIIALYVYRYKDKTSKMIRYFVV